jgi:hypothetical protein
MSLYEVERLIHRLNVEPALVARYRETPEAVLDEYTLDDAERAALKDGDAAALWRLGVHPLLMLHYTRVQRIPMPQMYEQIRPLAGQRKLTSARQP